MRSFASDNNAPIHPRVLRALQDANHGHAVAYGDDPWTERALALLRQEFGQDSKPFLVLTGTGANVLAVKAVTTTWQSVLCAENAHINLDECGAPECIAGCKLVPLAAENGKVRPETIRPHMHVLGFQHCSQPRVLSITQCTEYGTLYSPEEVRELADFVHSHDMLLHMDGARLANAAAALGFGLRQASRDLGVDVLSFGGAKNGLLCGEAVVFFHPEHTHAFKYLRKQGMQLVSKMRYIGAQFSALLEDGLWLENATHANRMATLLARRVAGLERVTVTRPVETNHVFAILPQEIVPELQRLWFFYVWDKDTCECRFVTSYDTTEADVEAFARDLEKLLCRNRGR